MQREPDTVAAAVAHAISEWPIRDADGAPGTLGSFPPFLQIATAFAVLAELAAQCGDQERVFVARRVRDLAARIERGGSPLH